MQKNVLSGLFLFIVSSLITTFCEPLLAQEQLGELRLADFLVEPTFKFSEQPISSSDTQTGFGLGNTYFAAVWKLNHAISGRIQLASLSLINQPFWVVNQSAGLGFVEAYGQFDSVYGTLRAGLVPVTFGLDGSSPETSLWFPRSFLYSQKMLPLRDYGATYSISNNGFFTDATVHNGEGGADQDDRLWQTARWGWRGGPGIQTGISGSVGYFNSPSVGDTKVRMGNYFFGMDLYGVGVMAEATIGEQKTASTQLQFVNWYLAYRQEIGKNWGTLLRYQYWNPSSRIPNDGEKQILGGLFFKNDTDTSRVTVTFIKNIEEGQEIANDQYMFTWRITSSAGDK